MKCDLHVHTVHSGMCTVPLLNRICRESYSAPQEVYETLKQRGMDLVTVTDHDSIDAAEVLRRHPDFFLSEEVTCRTPRGTELHMGVYDIAERDHIELQGRRDDLPALIAYLYERRLLFSVNHVFSGLTGRRTESDFDDFAASFPAVEILNGQMLAVANRYAEAFAARNRKAPVAGSDAHTLASLGRTYTRVHSARDRREFMEGLKRGRGTALGDSGDFMKLTWAVAEIGFEMLKERRWTALLSPLMAAIPLVTLTHLALETIFAHKWGKRQAMGLSYGVIAIRRIF
ncbi:MAG TPA: PHP-associated domain-containing protein [Bryobacteraceae bacterium]|jgi:predicted metal-dependent phosphoesterase TrpH|nr:PHP-associated domain-containing protein [Bryobacteraceae bacterium]